MHRRLLLLGCCLILLLPACQGPSDGRLTVVFPLESTELAGGEPLRVTVSLVDHDDQPVEGAVVQAELHAPNGDVFTTLPCADKGQGRYLADYVHLPLRGTKGTWRVVAQATWRTDGGSTQAHAHAERTFKGQISRSEKIQDLCGFWIEPLTIFDCQVRGIHYYQIGRYEDGGHILLEDHCHGIVFVTVSLDVHWRRADMPGDAAAAIAYVRSLEAPVDHDEDHPPTNLIAEPATFQGRSAWRVTGQWRRFYEEDRVRLGGPIEWTIFRCPDSPQDAAREWLWTIVIATNDKAFMDDLWALRETFECPTP